MAETSNDFAHRRFAATARTRDLSGVIFLHVVCSCAILIAWFTMPLLNLDPSQLTRTYSIVFVACSIYCLGSWVLLRPEGWFDHYAMFLIAVILFNGGQFALHALGLTDTTNPLLGDRFSDATLIQAIGLVTLSLMSLHTGAIIFGASKHGPRPRRQAPFEISDRAVFVVGWFFLPISLGPMFYLTLDKLSIVSEHGYFGIYLQEATTGWAAAPEILSRFFVPSALFIIAVSKSRPISLYVVTILVAVYVLAYLYIGLRSDAFVTLVALCWLWHRAIRPLPVSLIVAVGAVSMLVVIPVVAGIRNDPGAERNMLTAYLEQMATVENPLVDSVYEMGGSAATVAWTLELVPQEQRHEWGLSYASAIGSLLPNLGRGVHPFYYSLGDALVWRVDPQTAAAGGGHGFSFIGEAYRNFGWIGTMIFMCALGGVLARFVAWSSHTDRSWKYAFLASCALWLPYYARSESSVLVRQVAWYTVGPLVIAYMLTRQGQRHRQIAQ